jgi:hypothetical protein
MTSGCVPGINHEKHFGLEALNLSTIADFYVPEL